MKYAIIIPYCVVGFVSALWIDAMDRRYPPRSGLPPSSYAMTTLLGIFWPLSLPIYLGTMLTEEGGRWRLERIKSPSKD